MTTNAIKKILCVEDDRESAALIREELLERGFKVIVAHDSEEGLAAIEREWPDLVLCDIRMPGISGFEVLQRLRGRAPPLNGLRFVFITGWSDREVEAEATRLGADDFLVKPIDFDTLAAIIAGYSGTQHAVRALTYDIHHQKE